jgi:Putative metallopeptidase
MASVLNSTFKINTPLKLSLKECGTPNAFYNADTKELILCYEFLEFLRKMYENKYATPEEWGTKIGNVLSFIYFHEVGHTLIDLYNLPITGKEEDAADYFSFYLLGSNQVPEGELACVEGANFFADLSVYRDSINTILVKEGKPVNALPFWDEHSFDMQRFYNIFSLMYGSDPVKNAYLLDLNLLGERRPAIAISEYKKIKNGWNKILKDYIKWHK